jgi:hypothetical protein
MGTLLLMGSGCAQDFNEAIFGQILARSGYTVDYQGEDFEFQFKYPLKKEFKTKSITPQEGALETIQYNVGWLPAFNVNVYGKDASISDEDGATENYLFVVEGVGEPQEIVIKIKETFEASESMEVSDKSME